MKKQLPKVILHEHIEGSVTPDVAKVLAQKHNISLPHSFFYPQGQYDQEDFPNGRYHYDESDFGDFISTYDKVASLVRDPEDYYLIVKDYLTRNAQKGLIYCEIITSAFHLCFDEQKDTLDSKKYHQIMDKIEQAIREVNSQHGTITRLHACGVRHLSATQLNRSALFIKEQPRAIITGFNIAGKEEAGSFSDFTFVHDLVESIPLPKSYHAGETCGPESVREALKYGSRRIGHGIKAIEDDSLIDLLIKNGITLEIAPTSNRILLVEMNQSLDNHPLRKLYERGVRISLNTDDAGLFGTDIGKEYNIATTQFGFKRVELLDITLCALEAAFVEDNIKQNLIDSVYEKFEPCDWDELKAICAELPNGALKQRLQGRLCHYSRQSEKSPIT